MADYFISSFLIRYETWKRTFGWQNHSRLCVKQICLPSTTSNVTNDKTKLWKTVRLTSFQKPKLQSVSISLKYVHPCFLLYLLCYSYLLLTSWEVIFSFKVSLHSLAVPTVWTVTNLVTQFLWVDQWTNLPFSISFLWFSFRTLGFVVIIRKLIGAQVFE